MVNLNTNKQTFESATFGIAEPDTGVIEIIEPLIEVVDYGVVNHDVEPMHHSFSATSNPNGKIMFEISCNYLDEEESSGSFLEVPVQQVQELFDWLKASGVLR